MTHSLGKNVVINESNNVTWEFVRSQHEIDHDEIIAEQMFQERHANVNEAQKEELVAEEMFKFIAEHMFKE